MIRAYTERKLGVDQAAGQRMRGLVFDRHPRDMTQRRSIVDRAAETVEDTAEELGADRNRRRAFGLADVIAGAYAAQVAERHAHEFVVTDRDDFGDDRTVVGVDRNGTPDGQP